jgi:hypothetical protein
MPPVAATDLNKLALLNWGMEAANDLATELAGPGVSR